MQATMDSSHKNYSSIQFTRGGKLLLSVPPFLFGTVTGLPGSGTHPEPGMQFR